MPHAPLPPAVEWVLQPLPLVQVVRGVGPLGEVGGQLQGLVPDVGPGRRQALELLVVGGQAGVLGRPDRLRLEVLDGLQGALKGDG